MRFRENRGFAERSIGKRNGLFQNFVTTPPAREVGRCAPRLRRLVYWPSGRFRRLSSQQGEAFGAEPRTKADKTSPHKPCVLYSVRTLTSSVGFVALCIN